MIRHISINWFEVNKLNNSSRQPAVRKLGADGLSVCTGAVVPFALRYEAEVAWPEFGQQEQWICGETLRLCTVGERTEIMLLIFFLSDFFFYW